MRVGIVGAGITGLVAGYWLRKHGAEVTLYEASSRSGGPVHSIIRDGYLAEFGPNTIVATHEAVTALIADLGLGPRMLEAAPTAKNRYVIRDGELIPLPTTPGAFARSRLFSVKAKLRLLREPFIPKAAHDESIADFVRRRLGQEFLDYAINPFVAGIYAGDPERLSSEHAFPKLFALDQKYGSLIKGQFQLARARKKSGASKRSSQMLSFDRGLQVLIDALSNSLGSSIRLSTAVQEFSKTSEWMITDTSGNTQAFDHIILTAPAHALGKMHLGQIDLSAFSEIIYPSVTSLVLGFRRSDVQHPLDGFGMLVPAAEHANILGTIFSSSLFPDRAPEGHVTLTTYIGGMRQPEVALVEDSALLDIVLSDLRKYLGVTGQPTFVHRTTYRQAIPQYTMGYEKYKALMSNIESAHPGIHFAGNYRNGISVSDSINGATELAGQLLAHS